MGIGRPFLFLSFAIAVWAGAFALMPSPARANVVVQGFSDLEGYGNCNSAGATSASCATVDASASGSLATGVLKAFADCCDFGDPNYVSSGQAGANATYSDTITLVLPEGYSANNVPYATFLFSVDAPILSGGSTTANAARISDALETTPDFSRFYSDPSASGCYATDPQDFCGQPNTPLNLSVTITDIPVSDLVIGFTAEISVLARGNGALADASDPGVLSIVLPEGITFTSNSGALLTEVPEPRTWTLLLVPMLALAGLVSLRYRAH